MRRLLVSALLVASSVGIFTIPAAADPASSSTTTTIPSKVTLSFDYSDNSSPASASNGRFNIIVDVLPEHTPGVVKIVAVAPDSANVDNLTCNFQAVQQSQVECAFNFTASGVWSIRALYSVTPKDDVSAFARTNLRVAN
ncbi:MAG: hypothetical protein HIU84_04805 [Acidobacteria bacterium]|nr:hypothetical protein [Acidobacteriota bacterium]